ncbi:MULTISPECIES: hypothetical protein [Streptomyces]|uniref:Uncharacterized protein n=1 Tax=Streptomyces griseosporeus TaxID=1910 RepID=A0ABV3L0T0_STRGS|nr:hypothetical protein [Streptomyces actuosus]
MVLRRPGRVRPQDPAAAEEAEEDDERNAAERARIVACNRAWKAAAGPRQEFVKRLVRGKTLPDEARLFGQRTLPDLPRFYGKWADWQSTQTVALLLGVKDPENDPAFETAAGFPRNRLANVLVAQVARRVRGHRPRTEAVRHRPHVPRLPVGVPRPT